MCQYTKDLRHQCDMVLLHSKMKNLNYYIQVAPFIRNINAWHKQHLWFPTLLPILYINHLLSACDTSKLNLPDSLQTDRQCQRAGKLFLLPPRVIHITFSLSYLNSEHWIFYCMSWKSALQWQHSFVGICGYVY